MKQDRIPQTCSTTQLANGLLSEIALLLSRAGSIESEIESMLKREDLRLRASTIQVLQEMDLLTQSLQSISILLEGLREHAGSGDMLDMHEILARVPLRDMVSRILGGSPRPVSLDFTEF